jgi:hypothetical protein
MEAEDVKGVVYTTRFRNRLKSDAG